MTQEKMNLLVPQKLDALEKRYDIRVLLAVESGSLGPAVEHLLLNQFLLAELQF